MYWFDMDLLFQSISIILIDIDFLVKPQSLQLFFSCLSGSSLLQFCTAEGLQQILSKLFFFNTLMSHLLPLNTPCGTELDLLKS